jgi:hypothetical protein
MSWLKIFHIWFGSLFELTTRQPSPISKNEEINVYYRKTARGGPSYDKSSADEVLNDGFLKNSNADKEINDGFKKVTPMKRLMLTKNSSHEALAPPTHGDGCTSGIDIAPVYMAAGLGHCLPYSARGEGHLPPPTPPPVLEGRRAPTVLFREPG